MKRFISLLLALLLLSSLLIVPVTAQNAKFIYSSDDIEELYYDFEYVSGMVEDLFGKSDALAYWKYAEDMENKKLGSWLIDMSNKIIGEEPDEKYYTEILTNMIALFEYDLAEQIENQGQFDKMKNIKEYGLDIMDIGATVIGLDDEFEEITEVISVAADSVNLLVDNIKHIKYYELSIRNYANAENFLKAVNENSENEQLSKAAGNLRKANELLLKERFDYISETVGSTGSFVADTFFSDMSFALLKNTDAYKTDEFVKDFVGFGESAYSAIDRIVSTGEAVFKAVMLGGDVLFGTTNTFRRHNEMEAMADIAKAIIKEYEKINVSKNSTPESLYGAIRRKSEYYKMLIATHLRGEYLIYSLNYNDAGVLSEVTKFLDSKVEEEQSIKKWYNTQVEYCEKYYTMVNDIFERLTRNKFVVEGGFELHDGFIVEIEQKDSVPEGYIGVYSYDDFKKIADSCPSDAFITSIYDVETEFNTAKYILMNDITLPADFDSAGAFYGVFDGNGYTISGLNKSLFLTIGKATIKNLGLEISHTIDTNDTEYSFGAVAKTLNPFNNGDGSYIDNCFVKGSINIVCRSGYFGGLIGTADEIEITNSYNEADITVTTRQTGKVGGICGDGAAITNCYNTGDISLHTTCEMTMNVFSIDAYVGGIQGYNYAQNITNCYNTGAVKVSANGECWVASGGIVGYNYGAYYGARIENCYNIGRVSCEWTQDYDATKEYGYALGASYLSGGIVGFTGENLKINRCYNIGDVVGEHFVGGIAGGVSDYSDDSITNSYNMGNVTAVQFAGGLVGKDFYSLGIQNCYNMGSVSGATSGSLAGEIKNGEENLVNCYYLDTTAPATSAGINYTGVTEFTSEELGKIETFEGFDFVEIWKLRENDTQPLLKW